MDTFFNKGRQENIDILTFRMLQAVLEKDAYRQLAQHGFHFGNEIPTDILDAAFDWLEDVVFGDSRIKFYSKKVQSLYEDFVQHARSLDHEIGTEYSGGRDGHLKVNRLNMSGSEKRELQEKLSQIAKKTHVTLENLFTVAEQEFKSANQLRGL